MWRTNDLLPCDTLTESLRIFGIVNARQIRRVADSRGCEELIWECIVEFGGNGAADLLGSQDWGSRGEVCKSNRAVE